MSDPGHEGMVRVDRRRAWLVGAGVVVVLVAVALWVAFGRGERPAGGGSSDDMGDMSGMSMGGHGAMGDGTVQLTAAQLRHFGVTFASVEMRPLSHEVRSVGVVTIDSSRLVQVTPRFGGFVERLHVSTSGQAVRRGQPLLDVYSPELLAAQQELLVAATLARTAGRSAVPGAGEDADLVAAARQRLALWGISESQIAEVLRTGRPKRALTLSAPSTGVVLEMNVVLGQAIQPGQMLYTLADLRGVWVDAQLRESEAAGVRVGAGARVELSGLPGRSFLGRVTYVYPTLDPQARTVRARIAVSNTAGLLKPGMFATTRLETPTRRALTVPVAALVRTGERTLVFVDMGGGRLAPQEVEVGRVTADVAEILAGLEPGQRVVTSAQFLLDSESNLAEVMRAMMSQMGMSDMEGMDMPGMDMPGMEMPMDRGADVKGAMKGDMKGMPMPRSPAPERR